MDRLHNLSRIKSGILFILILIAPIVVFSQQYGQYQYGDKEEKSTDIFYTVGEDEVIFAQEDVIDPETYILGPGDKLVLNILTVENINMTLLVNPTGEILIPAVGVFNVAGKSLSTAVREVEQFILREAFPNAKINLSLLALRNFNIQVIGAVHEPGFFTVSPITRLHDIISFADGFHQFAREYEILIEHQDGSSESIDFFQYWISGDLKNNPTFLEGDIITVPFGNIETEGIAIRGSVDNRGYDIIKTGETLLDYLQRQTQFKSNADLDNVIVTRDNGRGQEFITVTPTQFDDFQLEAGDIVDILSERGVMVNGFVQAPGGYTYNSGFTVADYISMAGGNTIEGDPDKATVRHADGSTEKGQTVPVRRGDVIIVPRTMNNVLFGELSILQIAASVTTIVLTYIAATK